MKNKIIIILLVIVLMLTACGEKKENLNGVWIENHEDGSSENMQLFSDGTGIIVDYDSEGNTEENFACTWIAENGQLKITFDLGILGSHAISCKYEINNNTLTLWDDSGETTGIYQRVNK